MTQAEFKREMSVWGETFYSHTCPKLQAEIVRKIVNNKVMNDFEKMAILKNYIGDLHTNKSIVEAIKVLYKE